MNKLFKVIWIDQSNGEEQTHYVVTEDMNTIQDEYADIIVIKPLTPLEEL